MNREFVNIASSMPINVLIYEYQIINNKKSSLSSNQRKIIIEMIDFLKQNGSVTQEMLEATIEYKPN